MAVSDDKEVVFERCSYEPHSHASKLGVFVEESLEWMRGKGHGLSAVAVSGGPGSYTGLRIGVSMAKGLCFGYGVPLISVPTLAVMASEAAPRVGEGVRYLCPMIDARRMEVYSAIYDRGLRLVREPRAEVVDAHAYDAYLGAPDARLCYFGDGADKCRDLFGSVEGICFLDGIRPLATGMAALSRQAYLAKRFEDVAYFEPFYLKEFQATVPKNKVLGQ